MKDIEKFKKQIRRHVNIEYGQNVFRYNQHLTFIQRITKKELVDDYYCGGEPDI